MKGFFKNTYRLIPHSLSLSLSLSLSPQIIDHHIIYRYGAELALVEGTQENNFTSHLAYSYLKDANIKSYWLGMHTIDNLLTNTLESASGRFVSKYIGFWVIGQPDVRKGKAYTPLIANIKERTNKL